MENKLESDQTIETVGVVKGEKNKAAQKKIILIAAIILLLLIVIYKAGSGLKVDDAIANYAENYFTTRYGYSVDEVKVVSSEEIGDDWCAYVVTMNCDTGNYYGTLGAGHYLVCYVIVSEENGEEQVSIPDYNVDAKTKSTFKKIVQTYKKDLKNYRALKE